LKTSLYTARNARLMVKIFPASQVDAVAFHNLAEQIDQSGAANFNFANELQWPSARYLLVRLADEERRRRRRHPLAKLTLALAAALNGLLFSVRQARGELVGGGGMWLTADGVANISFVGILPRYQKLKIGVLLLAKLIEIALKQGCSKITLELRQSNRDALEFYKKLGFAETGKIKNYYEAEQEDAITMALTAARSKTFKQWHENAQAALDRYWVAL